MRTLLLMSLVVVTFALPMRFARDASAVRGLQRTIVAMAVAVALYVIALIYVFPHLS